MTYAICLTQPAYLSIEESKLRIHLKETGELVYKSLHGLGYLLLDHPQIVVSQSLLGQLAHHNVALVVTDRHHMPSFLGIALHSHHMASLRLQKQLEAPLPLKKQLWKKIIQQKIRNQSLLLACCGKQASASHLVRLVSQVASNDQANKEAEAACLYWKSLFGKTFVRLRVGNRINAGLNYGYAILRALVARALTSSGLFPMAGIHHHNRYNPYCLADDIMEPYRPFVDALVYERQFAVEDSLPLEKEMKKKLLGLGTLVCKMPKGLSRLACAIELTAASLAQCFETKTSKPLRLFPFSPLSYELA